MAKPLAQGDLVGRAGGIAQLPAREHLGVRRQVMRIYPRGAEDVDHVLTASNQRVGHQQAEELRELPRRVSDRVDHSKKQSATAGLVATRPTGELDAVSGEEDV